MRNIERRSLIKALEQKLKDSDQDTFTPKEIDQIKRSILNLNRGLWFDIVQGYDEPSDATELAHAACYGRSVMGNNTRLASRASVLAADLDVCMGRLEPEARRPTINEDYEVHGPDVARWLRKTYLSRWVEAQ
jgi:hypothetical protein